MRVLLRDEATTISDGVRVASFDLEGRWMTYFDGRALYKRALAGEVHFRGRAGGRRLRRRLRRREAIAVHEAVLAFAAEAQKGAAAEVRSRLARILSWSPESLDAERDRFLRIYAPISILPPDRYLSVVLQATLGCTWNRCTFCSFYSGRPFQAKDAEDFRAHALAVRGFLGRALALRKGVFLADGNALALSLSRLTGLFDVVEEVFPGQPVYSFIDLYTGERHEEAFWRELRERGLAAVYVGMETGHDPLLAWLNKPGSASELVDFVSMLKGVGLGVGLIVMVGVGGRAFQAAHRKDTLSALSRMPLDREDVVFLSPFVEDPASVYAQRRLQASIEPIEGEALEAELAWFAKAVRAVGLRAARYDIREFLY